MRDSRALVDEYYIQYTPQSIHDLLLKTKQSLETCLYLRSGLMEKYKVEMPYYKNGAVG